MPCLFLKLSFPSSIESWPNLGKALTWAGKINFQSLIFLNYKIRNKIRAIAGIKLHNLKRLTYSGCSIAVS